MNKTYNANKFSYIQDVLSLSSNLFVASLLKKIDSPAELQQLIGRNLLFPDWYGQNWDALLDCLRDLTWLDDFKVIVLLHGDLPQLKKTDMRIYLEILCDVCEFWSQREEHDFIVIFPEECRKRIDEIFSSKS